MDIIPTRLPDLELAVEARVRVRDVALGAHEPLGGGAGDAVALHYWGGVRREKRGRKGRREVKLRVGDGSGRKRTISQHNAHAPTDAHSAMHQHPLPLHPLSRSSQSLLNDQTQLPEHIKQVFLFGVVFRHIQVRDALLRVLLQCVGGEVFAHDCEDEGDILGGEEVGVGGRVGAGGQGWLVVGFDLVGGEGGTGRGRGREGGCTRRDREKGGSHRRRSG